MAYGQIMHSSMNINQLGIYYQEMQRTGSTCKAPNILFPEAQHPSHLPSVTSCQASPTGLSGVWVGLSPECESPPRAVSPGQQMEQVQI